MENQRVSPKGEIPPSEPHKASPKEGRLGTFKVSTVLTSLASSISKAFRVVDGFFKTTSQTVARSKPLEERKVSFESTSEVKSKKEINTLEDLFKCAENDFITYEYKLGKKKPDDSLPNTFKAALELKEKYENDLSSAKNPKDKEAIVKKLISVSIIQWASDRNVLEKYGASSATVTYILDETRDHREKVKEYVQKDLKFLVEKNYLTEAKFEKLVNNQVDNFETNEETKGFSEGVEFRYLKPGDRPLDLGRG